MGKILDERSGHEGRNSIEGQRGTENWPFAIPSGEGYVRAEIEVTEQIRGGARISGQPALGAGGRQTISVNWWYEGTPVPRSPKGKVVYRVQAFSGGGGEIVLLRTEEQQFSADTPLTGKNGLKEVIFDLAPNERYALCDLTILDQRRGDARIAQQPATGASGTGKKVVISWWCEGSPNLRAGKAFIKFRVRIFVNRR
jgi:hypothetical protein